ncbi:MAG: hypothetical protein GY953_03195, partial [bacterium]|nr:hypothetical protein [bacterium]
MRTLILLLALTAFVGAEPIILSPDSDYADFPSLAVTPSGEAYVAWVSYDQRGADTVRLRRFSNGRWQQPMPVTPTPGDYFKTAMAVDSGGRVWITWAARVNGNVDLYARTLTGGKWSSVERLTTDPQPDFHHRLLAGGDGKLYLAWQSFRTGDPNIYLKVFDGKSWSNAIAVTTHEAGDWEPAIALDSRQRLHIVYDTYRHGDYDVFLRTYADGELSREFPIASSPNFEARATITVDHEDRAWIAWDKQGPGWGLDRPLWKLDSQRGDWGPPAPWVANLDPNGVADRISIRYSQRISVAVFADGSLWRPKTPLLDNLPEELAVSYEIPHLAAQSDGSVRMLFRHWIKWGSGHNMSRRPAGWDIYSTTYQGDAWSQPQRLIDGTGSNDQRVATAVGPDNALWVAYSGDDRRAATGDVKPLSKRHGRIRLDRLAPSAGARPELTTIEPPSSRPFKRTAAINRRSTIASGEKRYQLYWADLHRHTEISGDGGYDGT